MRRVRTLIKHSHLIGLELFDALILPLFLVRITYFLLVIYVGVVNLPEVFVVGLQMREHHLLILLVESDNGWSVVVTQWWTRRHFHLASGTLRYLLHCCDWLERGGLHWFDLVTGQRLEIATHLQRHRGQVLILLPEGDVLAARHQLHVVSASQFVRRKLRNYGRPEEGGLGCRSAKVFRQLRLVYKSCERLWSCLRRKQLFLTRTLVNKVHEHICESALKPRQVNDV